jgi:hypothetical protein
VPQWFWRRSTAVRRFRTKKWAPRANKQLTGNRPPPLMQLRWTEEAANDLERIADYLLLQSLGYQ